MCGRFVITSPPAALRQIFGYIEQPNFPPRHNIAPTQPIPVVILENGIRHFRLMRWGLLPGWVEDPRKFTLLFNARAETVLEKPARSEEHTSELQSPPDLVCRLLLDRKSKRLNSSDHLRLHRLVCVQRERSVWH